MEKMSDSMVDMNVKLEKVITDQSWHNREIEEIKENQREIFKRINSQQH